MKKLISVEGVQIAITLFLAFLSICAVIVAFVVLYIWAENYIYDNSPQNREQVCICEVTE